MPRRERPLDPDDGVLYEFAVELRRVREAAGSPTYREMSRRAHYSAAALSQAASGRQLPSLAVTLAYVTACGADAQAWEARWYQVASKMSALDGTAQSDGLAVEDGAPYVGLAAFQPTDAGRFFGREDLVAGLLERMRVSRLVGVFGPSGSGKSSVLRAGVAATVMADGLLGRGSQPTVVLTPGSRPMEECAVRLADLTGHLVSAVAAELAKKRDNLHLWVRGVMAGRPADEDLVLVVDQFEEVFTLCQDPAERHEFVMALVTAATAPTSRLRVVLGVRADFYGRCGEWPDLADALQNSQILVGAMTPDQLRTAIIQPALRAGYTVEGALVTRLVADATGQPAVLPLLSHVLLETWRRRRGTILNLTSYDAAGGIDHAVARTAETAYSALDLTQQTIARQLFLRLIAVTEDTEPTKRRIRRTELNEQDPNTGTVLDALAHARLITLDRDRIDIAHEALIRCWARLRTWVDSDRDGLRIHRQLTEATDTWQALDRDDSTLYRGTRLAITREWVTENEDLLNPRERDFLGASVDAEQAERRRSRRRARRLRQLAAILTLLILVTVTTVILAIRSQREVAQQHRRAIVEQAVTLVSSLDSRLAIQVRLAAYRLDPTELVRGSLLGTFQRIYVSRVIGHKGAVNAVAFALNGQILISAGADRAVALWDITDPYRPRKRAVITGHAASVRTVAVSPNGHILATGADDHTVKLWDISNPDQPEPKATIINHHDVITSVTFAPTGHLLATASADHTLRLWDTNNPAQPTELAAVDNRTTVDNTMTFSPDGHLLATANTDHTAHLWNIDNPRRPTLIGTAIGHTDIITSVTFVDTARLATGSADKTTRLWDTTDPRHPTQYATLGIRSILPEDVSQVDAVSASPTHHQLVIASRETGVSIWDITYPYPPEQFAAANTDAGNIHAVTFSPDGSRFAAAGSYGEIEFVELPYLHVPESIDDLVPDICRRAYPTITQAEWNQYFPGFPYQPPCP